MNIVTQEAKKKQAVVEFAYKKGKSAASEKYGVSLSSVKRWCARYDGTWQSLKERSHRPHNHPNRHTPKEERQIKNSFKKKFKRYGWDGVYTDLLRKGYKRSFSGMVYAAKRMGLHEQKKPKKKSRKQRRYPELLIPGEKVQIDVKEVPFNCLRGKALRDNKHFYQWTAIDECTRMRFVYAFEEHTPENSVINHKLIPPRTPWHNGKVERSHRNDQRYFYDWETFTSVEELNRKLKDHLEWSNSKRMRTLDWKSAKQLLAEKLSA